MDLLSQQEVDDRFPDGCSVLVYPPGMPGPDTQPDFEFYCPRPMVIDPESRQLAVYALVTYGTTLRPLGYQTYEVGPHKLARLLTEDRLIVLSDRGGDPAARKKALADGLDAAHAEEPAPT